MGLGRNFGGQISKEDYNIKASAPGKILIAGGYAVLERPNVSLVLAIDKTVDAKFRRSKENTIKVDVPQLNISATGKIEGANVILSDISEEEKNKLKFVKAAIEVSIAYLKANGKKVDGFSIETYSDPVFSITGSKSGLGSSAAVSVATVGAVLSAYGVKSKKIIHNLAQIAHITAQNKIGSGFDVACATFGTIEYVRYSPEIVGAVPIPEASKIKEIAEKEWDYKIKKIKWPNYFKVVVGNFIGTSASTTSMVLKVNEFKKAKPDEYSSIIKEINENDEKLVKTLNKLGKLDYKEASKYLDEFKYYFEKARIATKQLGEKSGAEIEPDEYSELIQQTYSNGAFAVRLPGAGGGDSIVAICLSNEDAENVKKFWKTQTKLKVEVLPVQVSTDGLKVYKK